MTAEDTLCTIRLVRPFLAVDIVRSYKILLNGKAVGKIGNAGTLEIRAPAGAITIEARINWARSRPLTIQTEPRQTYEIEVRNHWGAMRGLWAVTFGKDTYLLLTPRPMT